MFRKAYLQRDPKDRPAEDTIDYGAMSWKSAILTVLVLIANYLFDIREILKERQDNGK